MEELFLNYGIFLFYKGKVYFGSPGSDWSHEKGSTVLFDRLVDNNNIDISQEDRTMVKDLILANSEKPVYNEMSKFLKK